MRTTIRLPDDLLAEAKRLAAETQRTLTNVIEDAIREALARHHAPRKAKPRRLTTFKGSGLLPGIGLDDSAALVDAMESIDAADRR